MIETRQFDHVLLRDQTPVSNKNLIDLHCVMHQNNVLMHFDTLLYQNNADRSGFCRFDALLHRNDQKHDDLHV